MDDDISVSAHMHHISGGDADPVILNHTAEEFLSGSLQLKMLSTAEQLNNLALAGVIAAPLGGATKSAPGGTKGVKQQPYNGPPVVLARDNKHRPGKGPMVGGPLAINLQAAANIPLIGSKMKLSPRNTKGLSLPPIPSHHPSQSNNQGSLSDEEGDGIAGGAPSPMMRSRSNKNMVSRMRDLRSSFPSSVAEEGNGSPSAVASKLAVRKNVNTMKKQRSASFSKVNNTYRYKVLPGNNSRVILASMKKRPWWHASFGGGGGSSFTGANSEPEPEDLSMPPPSFLWEMYRNSSRYNAKNLDYYRSVLINKIPKNKHLVTKKGLYYSIKEHCTNNNLNPLSVIPLTFYLAPGSGHPDHPSSSGEGNGIDDLVEFKQFCESHPCGNKEEIRFIMKPASKTNRGFGIKVVQGMTNVLDTVSRGYSAGSEPSSSRATGADTGNGGGKNAKNNKKKTSGGCGDDTNCAPNAPSSSGANAGSVGPENNALTKAAKRIAQQDGYIVQLYIEQPLLIQQRKFDIRCFVLVTHSNIPTPGGGSASKGLKAYFYPNAYIRTSSKKYTLNNLNDREIHLTNDAVQKNSQSYGKYEDGNKLSLQQWQQMLIEEYIDKPSVGSNNTEGGEGSSSGVGNTQGLRNIVFDFILPEMKRLCQLSICSVAEKFSQSDMNHSFEVFGYDFMICDREKDVVPPDASALSAATPAPSQRFYPVLIEVNTNPCLEFVTPYLEELLTDVIESSIRIAVDGVYPPPSSKQNRTRTTEEAIAEIESNENKFVQIYPVN